MPLNITHINTVSHVGGAAKVMTRLVKFQREKGHLCKMLISGYKQKRVPLIFDGTDYLPPTVEEIMNHPYIKKADVIHLHNLHGGEYFNMNVLPKLSKAKKVIWTLHDMWAFTGHCCYSLECNDWHTECKKCMHTDYVQAIESDCAGELFEKKRKIYKDSKLTIVTPSKWLLDLVSCSVLKNHPLHLICNAVDTKVFYPKRDKLICRRKFSLPTDKFIIGSSANGGVLLNGNKGGKYIREIMKLLAGKDVVFANFGALETSIEGNIYNIENIIDEDELMQAYNTMDAMVHTPYSENCPLILLEAAACAVPIIVFNVGGCAELVSHFNTGYVVNNYNCKTAATYVSYLMENRNVLDNISRQIHEYALKNFDIVGHYEKYLRLYR